MLLVGEISEIVIPMIQHMADQKDEALDKD
jgi:hypothetical protein